MLPKAGHQCAQRGDLEEDILGKAGSFFAEYYKRPGNMPRSALLCPKIKILAVTSNLGLEIECSG